MTLLFLNNLQDLAEIQKISYLKFIFQSLKEGFRKLSYPITRTEERLYYFDNQNFVSQSYTDKKKIKFDKPFQVITELVNFKFIHPELSYIDCKFNRMTYDFIVKFPITLIPRLKIFEKHFIGIKCNYFYGRIPLLTSDGTYLINGCERIVVNQLTKKPGITFEKIHSKENKFIYFANIISSNNRHTRIYLDEIDRFTPEGYKPKEHHWADIYYIEHNNNVVEFKNYNNKNYSAQEILNFKQFIMLTKIIKNFEKKEKKIKKDIFTILKFFRKDNLTLNYEKLNLKYKKYYLVYILLKVSQNLFFESCDKITNIEENSENFIKIREITTNYYTHYRKRLFEDINISFIVDKSQLLKLYNINKKNIYFQILSDSKFKFDEYSYSTIKLSNRYNYNTYIKGQNIQKKIIRNYFYRNRLYLGSLGRDSFNKRFEFNFNKLHSDFIYNLSRGKYMTIDDFIHIFNKLYNVKYNYDNVDNIDDLDYKQIKSSGEFLRQYFNLDLMIKGKLKSFVGLIHPIYNFFVATQISQYADQINPLSTLAHKRKLSLFGPGGLERERIDANLRNINPTQFNKICFIETAEGRNAGVVTTLALTSRISKNLNLETPYIFVNSKIYSTSNLVFLDTACEKKSLIGFENCLEDFKKEILIRKNLDFLVKNFKKLNYLTLCPIQTLSLGISIIPFIEHNDGNRALMGSNMQRQAVPLLNSNRAIVGIGREYNIASDSKFVIRSYSEGIIQHINNFVIFLNDTKNQFLYYNLPQNFITNQYLTSLFKPSVWINEKIFTGEIIAISSNVIENELALGSNLTLAYMSWEGYNFEDAIIINEKLITNNILTSIHTNIYEISIPFMKLIQNIMQSNIHKKSESVFNINTTGILKTGSYVYPGNPILEYKNKRQNLKHFINNNILKKNSYLTISSEFKFEGRLVKVIARKRGNKLKLKLYVAKSIQIEVGDKLSGRHGNKGIISRILSNDEMPYLPNGDAIHLIVNPLGVPSRMNVGQLFECLLGISGEKLGFRYKVFPFDETISKNSSRILVHTFMYKSMYQLKRSWFYSNNRPGKILLRDGRTGEYYDNIVIVGKAYILKLIHLVEDKIHSRALGPYSSVTEQPLQGKANAGGQRFGEMEVWALEAYGSSITLQELLTTKSDSSDVRENIYLIIKEQNLKFLPIPMLPEIFILLINELKALILSTSFNKPQKSLYFNINSKLNLFKYLENQLKIKKKFEL